MDIETIYNKIIAKYIFINTKFFKDKTDYESRLKEIEYFLTRGKEQYRAGLPYLKEDVINACCSPQREIFSNCRKYLEENGVGWFFDICRMMLMYNRNDICRNDLSTVFGKILYYLYCKQSDNYNMLDYGAGVGDASVAFGQLGFHVSFVNTDNEQNDFLRYRLQLRHIPHKGYKVNQGQFPYFARYYSVCIDHSALEHVENLCGVLQNIYDHLISGGIFYSTFLNWMFFDKKEPDWNDKTKKEAISSEFRNVFRNTFGKCKVLDCPNSIAKIFIKR